MYDPCKLNLFFVGERKPGEHFMKLSQRFLSLALAVFTTSAMANMPKWSYDAGPNPDTAMGRELIDITANIPNMPMLSNKIVGRSQKFRPAFGPIPWRMLQEENKVKMLFLGQDGTHIAEAAGRPATAGFGGRAQDLAKYFGVNEGAAFINTYSFTIKGQYGVYNTPYIYRKDGETSVKFANFVDNKFWLLSMGMDSPITKWRNSLIDWIIRNNKDSMKLIVTFGGAARDAIATYAKSKGAVVEAYAQKDAMNIQMPETRSEYAGGNNTFPSIVGRDGKDLYEKMLGKKLDYSNAKDQKAVVADLKSRLQEYKNEMVFTKGGEAKNGMVNLAQLGGYNIAKMYVKGKNTRSLKGLELDDGTIIENDILIVELPHPSSLSRTVVDADSYAEGKAAASKRVMTKVRALNKYKKKGWAIEADPGQTNFYDQGENYDYGRSDIGPEFYDFGTPKNRMVSKSTARRMSGNAHVVIIGTRDRGNFSSSDIKRLTNEKASIDYDPANLFTARPKTLDMRYTFDPGPGEKFAKLMVKNLDFKTISKEKEGKSFENDGIDAYNIKSHPSVGTFGHYRGTFENPEVIVLADPMGYDDIATARALTGSRGQYLQNMMNDSGVKDNYLVFKTVPVVMDGATKAEWETVIDQTKGYRDAVFKELLKTATPKVVIADGLYALREARRIFEGTGVTVLSWRRKGDNPAHQYRNVVRKLNKLGCLGKFKSKPKMADIPRTHLSFYARVWEGTSGDRVITSRGTQYKGIAFAVVVPKWAYKHESGLTDKSQGGVDALIDLLDESNMPLPYETIPGYLKRTNTDPGITFLKQLENFFDIAA